MIATMVFCLCVTGLCCYTVHMLLEERTQTQSAIYKAMMEVDQMSLRKPLKIIKRRSNHIYKMAQKTRRTDTTDTTDIIDITPQRVVENSYPIIPADKLAIGYGFDMRV